MKPDLPDDYQLCVTLFIQRGYHVMTELSASERASDDDYQCRTAWEEVQWAYAYQEDLAYPLPDSENQRLAAWYQANPHRVGVAFVGGCKLGCYERKPSSRPKPPQRNEGSSHEEMRRIFLSLWIKAAGTANYDEREWQRFRDLLKNCKE